MSKMIQVRNVSDEVHRKLKMRAAAAGLTLSDYLVLELEAAAATPSPGEMRERLDRLAGPYAALDHAAAVRFERDGR